MVETAGTGNNSTQGQAETGSYWRGQFENGLRENMREEERKEKSRSLQPELRRSAPRGRDDTVWLGELYSRERREKQIPPPRAAQERTSGVGMQILVWRLESE